MRILSIDGGGVKGLLSASVCEDIEKEIRVQTGDPKAKLGNYFDMVAGTSVGGLLAILNFLPKKGNRNEVKYSAEEIKKIFLKLLPDIFRTSFWSVKGFLDNEFVHDKFEKKMKKIVSNKDLSQLVGPSLITAYDYENDKAVFFTQHTCDKKDYSLVDIGRATSAAPTLFEPKSVTEIFSGKKTKMIDGMFTGNSPALYAVGEALDSFDKSLEDLIVVSIGTGKLDVETTKRGRKDIDSWGKLEWLPHIIGMLSTGQEQTSHYQLTKRFGRAGVSDNYLRLQGEYDGEAAKPDDITTENLIKLNLSAKKLINDKKHEIKKIVKKIIEGGVKK